MEFSGQFIITPQSSMSILVNMYFLCMFSQLEISTKVWPRLAHGAALTSSIVLLWMFCRL